MIGQHLRTMLISRQFPMVTTRVSHQNTPRQVLRVSNAQLVIRYQNLDGISGIRPADNCWRAA